MANHISELKNYLEKLRDRLSRLPTYYPAGLSFEQLYQRAKVGRRIVRLTLPPRKDPYLAEAARRGGYLEEEDEYFVIEDWDELRMPLRRTVVLGDPGFGKSWLLRYEGYRAASEQLARLHHSEQEQETTIVPIYLHLETLAEELARGSFDASQAIMHSLQRQYDLSEGFVDWMRQRLASPQTSLLLDALDEVAEERLPALIEALTELTKQTRCRMLITSRTAGYSALSFLPMVDGREREPELIGFEWNRVRAFIRQWFVADRKRGEHLLLTLRREPTLYTLTQIPLLLSLLCCLASKKKVIPTKRPALYEAILRGLVSGSWRAEQVRAQSKKRTEEKLALLERVAWHFATHDGSWRDLLPGSELKAVLQQAPQAEYLLKTAQHGRSLLWELSEQDGVLVRVGAPTDDETESQGHVRFLHRNFQTYLLARSLAQQQPEQWWEQVKPHLWFDREWAEIIVLLAGCLADPNPLVEALLAEPNDAFHSMLFLAGYCIAGAQKGAVKPELVERVSEELLTLLPSASYRDFNLAIHVLGYLGGPVARAALQVKLQNITESGFANSMVIRAAKALGKSGDLKAVPALVGTLLDRRGVAHQEAAEALGRIGGRRAMDGLLKSLELQVNLASAHLAEVEALGQIDDPQVVERLLVMLRDKSVRPDMRGTAAMELGKIGDPRAVEGLLAAWQDSSEKPNMFDVSIWGSAAKSLGQIGDGRAVPWLLAPLHERPWGGVQLPVVWALGRIGDPSAVEGLLALLRRESQGLDILKEVNRAPVQERIEELLKIIELDILKEIKRALVQIGNQQVENGLQAVLLDEDVHEDVRIFAAAALGEMGNLQMVERLLTRLRNKDNYRTNYRLRTWLVQELRAIGDPQAVPGLLAALQEKEAKADLQGRLRFEALWALIRIGGAQVAEGLLAILQDNSEQRDVYLAAAEVLGKMGDARGVEMVQAILSDKTRNDQSDAAYTLARIADAQATKVLLTALRDEESRASVPARFALEWLSSYKGIPGRLDFLLPVEVAETSEKLVRFNNLRDFCDYLLRTWPEAQTSGWDRRTKYESLARWGSLLRQTVGDDWPQWRARLMLPTRDMIDLGLKQMQGINE